LNSTETMEYFLSLPHQLSSYMKNISGVFALVSTAAAAQPFHTEPVFIQNSDKTEILSETSSLTLKREPFTLQFRNAFYNTRKEQFYSVQVALIEKEEDLAHIEEGMPVSLIPYFETGTGMPADENGFYSSAVLNSYGHHYLYYENEKNRSVRLLSKKEGTGRFEWDVERMYINGKDYPVSKIPLTSFYFVCLNDSNLNGIIDSGELYVVKLHFK